MEEVVKGRGGKAVMEEGREKVGVVEVEVGVKEVRKDIEVKR